MEKQSIRLEFANNRVLPELFGKANRNLSRLEEQLDVSITSRGGVVALSGASPNVSKAKAILRSLYDQLDKGGTVTDGEIDAMIRMLREETEAEEHGARRTKHKRHSRSDDDAPVALHTMKSPIKAYSPMQAKYIDALTGSELVFGAGPAGTGKTYIAVAAAVAKFIQGKVERIILSRPAVEAGEQLGFLPGDMKDKVDPYLRPLYDALYDMLPAERVVRLMASGEIEIAPLAFMRGRTLRNAFAILDEAQNTTPAQMKMFLTRLGEGSYMAITGDLTQTDLPKGQRSGFRDAIEILEKIPEVKIIRFSKEDVVRHPLTEKIVAAYEQFEDDSKWKRPDKKQT